MTKTTIREKQKMLNYYYLHNPIDCISRIWGYDLPWTSIERIWLDWYVPFPTDCSGRSTAKTHNKLMVNAAKSICIADRRTLLLGQDKGIGIELFDEHINNWLVNFPNFKKYCRTMSGKGEARVSHKDEGAYLYFKNNSTFYTLSPDWQQGGRKMQSRRVNALIFNEWTTFCNRGSMEDMMEEVEPIATRNAEEHRLTRLFREVTEGHIGEPLGLLSDEEMGFMHKGEKNYEVRKTMKTAKRLKRFADVRERFYANFYHCYGFHYEAGVQQKELGLKPIKRMQDIRDFFKLFLEGDPPYQNQIFYDGSAKRPSEESYRWIEYINKQVGKEVEERMDFMEWSTSKKIRNHYFSYYSVSVDDVPSEYDGVIYDSKIIGKYRRTHLEDDFERVYGGRWVEGASKKPYDPSEILALRAPKDKSHPLYFDIELKQIDPNAEYLMAIDVAAGTEASVRGMGQMRGSKGSPGDDGAAALFKLGDSTPENPDKLINIYVADDIRPEPMAFDIQKMVQAFPNIIWMLLDPGGGGAEVAKMLQQTRLTKEGVTENFTPIYPIDFEGETLAAGIKKIVLISRSTDIMKMVYVNTADERALWAGNDMLNHTIHTKARLAVQNRTVLFPPNYNDFEITDMLKRGEISYAQAQIYQNVNRALHQMGLIYHPTERMTGKVKLTSRGVPQYACRGRKDLAYVTIYGLYGIYVWRELQTMTKQAANSIGTIVLG